MPIRIRCHAHTKQGRRCKKRTKGIVCMIHKDRETVNNLIYEETKNYENKREKHMVKTHIRDEKYEKWYSTEPIIISSFGSNSEIELQTIIIKNINFK